MGVYHFATVGRWPGAVTTALAHLKHHKDQFISRGSVIDSVVLFTTPEIASGTVKTPEAVFNGYQSLKSTQRFENVNAVDVVVEFIKREIAELMSDGSKVYCCILEDHGDYQSCFETVARAALHFSPPGSTLGANIWANLTGGTNVMNAALHQIASLSGLISKLYYVFLAEELQQKYLQPTSADSLRFRWEEIPLIKTAIDPVYDKLLSVLGGLGDGWYLDEEILSRLKSEMWADERVVSMSLEVFRKEYLNKMDDRVLKRENPKSRAVKLSDEGREWLERLQTDLYRALIQRGLSLDSAGLSADLQIEELWSK